MRRSSGCGIQPSQSQPTAEEIAAPLFSYAEMREYWERTKAATRGTRIETWNLRVRGIAPDLATAVYDMRWIGEFAGITQSLCLAAHALGLGTCIEAQLALYPDLIRQHLNLTATHKIAVGLALGYPDPSAPANVFRTEREPLEKCVQWVGW